MEKYLGKDYSDFFFTSDLHISHRNILKYDNRPFKNIEEHDQALINNINNKVNEKSCLFILGDVSMTSNMSYLGKLLNQIKCDMVLIKGNHDSHLKQSFLNQYFIDDKDYLELKTELEQKGYIFNTNSDTEVLIALYDLKKEKCLDELDGMFAFALYDNYEKITFCARDRFGEKPFYYHINNDAFYFASEMKALWDADINKEPNLRKVFLYLAYNTQDDTKNLNHTFYKNIFKIQILSIVNFFKQY